MPHYDAASAECLVLTHKEGLLSAIAHDLAIRVESFDLDIDDASLAVRARFDAGSLRVVHALHDGAPRPDALSASDKQKIEHSIATEVLHVRQHPSITFASSAIVPDGDGYRVSGELTLHGETRLLTFAARREGSQVVAEVELRQPDFGIKPYTAMLGALKVKPVVTVRCSVPR